MLNTVTVLSDPNFGQGRQPKDIGFATTGREGEHIPNAESLAVTVFTLSRYAKQLV